MLNSRKSLRIIAISIVAVSLLLSVSMTGAEASEYSYFEQVREFFGFRSEQTVPEAAYSVSIPDAFPQIINFAGFTGAGFDSPTATPTATQTPGPTMVINEIDYQQPDSDNKEFIELKNISAGTINLDNYTVDLAIRIPFTTVYTMIDLPNVNVVPGGYFVICGVPANVPNCNLDHSTDSAFIENVPGAVGLRRSGGLVDAISFGGNTSGYSEGGGTSATDSDTPFVGLSRFPDGADTNNNGTDVSIRCISPGVSNAAGVSACTNPNLTPTPTATPTATPTPAFAVLSVSPANGATNVPTNTSITVTFDQPANPATVTRNVNNNCGSVTVQVSNNNFASCIAMEAPVASNGNTTFTLSPSMELDPATQYRVRVTTGVTTAGGSPLSAQFDQPIGFSTFAFEVAETVPTDGATGVAVNTSISVTFNLAANPATVTRNTNNNCGTATLQLSSNNFATCIAVGGVVRTNGDRTFTVIPSAPLSQGTTYKIRVTTGVQTPFGSPLTDQFDQPIGFKTFTPFNVSGVAPTQGAMNVPRDTTIVITFTEPANPVTVTSSAADCTGGSVRLSSDNFGQCVVMNPPVASAGNTVFTFTPSTQLAALTNYRRRVTTAVQNASGTPLSAQFEEPIGFITAAPPEPTVTSGPVNVATTTTATLNGTANPNGSATTAWYRYSLTDPGTCNDTFGTRVPVAGGTALGSGTSPVNYPVPIAGLTAATTYYYCAIAQNTFGTSFGSVVAFSTNGPPTVTTNAPSSVTSTSATLNGMANPNGISTTGWFRYNNVDPGTCNDSFGTRVPFLGGSSLGAGRTSVAYTEPTLALSNGTTYYVCAIAMNSAGTAFGSVVSFTAGPPSISGSVTYELDVTKAVPGTILTGSGSPTVMTTSSVPGTYVLSGFGSGPYTITPSRPNMLSTASNGIFSNDAALVSRHIVGSVVLSPRQQAAGKVSGGMTLTSFDAGLIARWIVGITSGVNQTGQWKFMPVSRTYPAVSGGNSNQNYTALLMGDVSGDWVVSGSRSGNYIPLIWETISVSAPDMQVTTGEAVTVPLRLDNLMGKEVSSLQFDVHYDPAVITAEKIAADINGTMSDGLTIASNLIEPGILKVVVYGAFPVYGEGTYVQLKFRSNGRPGSSSPIAISGFRLNDGRDAIIVTNGSIAIGQK